MKCGRPNRRPGASYFFPRNRKKLLTSAMFSLILNKLSSSAQMWRSRVVWSSAHDWKSCIPHKGIESSNLSFSAIKPYHYRCSWEKPSCINVFRTFRGRNFLCDSKDAKTGFSEKGEIRTLFRRLSGGVSSNLRPFSRIIRSSAENFSENSAQTFKPRIVGFVEFGFQRPFSKRTARFGRNFLKKSCTNFQASYCRF